MHLQSVMLHNYAVGDVAGNPLVQKVILERPRMAGLEPKPAAFFLPPAVSPL